MAVQGHQAVSQSGIKKLKEVNPPDLGKKPDC